MPLIFRFSIPTTSAQLAILMLILCNWSFRMLTILRCNFWTRSLALFLLLLPSLHLVSALFLFLSFFWFRLYAGSVSCISPSEVVKNDFNPQSNPIMRSSFISWIGFESSNSHGIDTNWCSPFYFIVTDFTRLPIGLCLIHFTSPNFGIVMCDFVILMYLLDAVFPFDWGILNESDCHFFDLNLGKPAPRL